MGLRTKQIKGGGAEPQAGTDMLVLRDLCGADKGAQERDANPKLCALEPSRDVKTLSVSHSHVEVWKTTLVLHTESKRQEEGET